MQIIPGFVRRHKKKSIAGAVVVVLLGFLVLRMASPKQPEYVTDTSKQGDIRQTVEAVGTVISERDLELRFASAGIVQAVLVKEGDAVRAGQRLAQLRSGNLGASVASQQASLQSALADLRAMEEGTRPEDIAVAEADVASRRASLQVATSTLESAETNLRTAIAQLEKLEQEASVSLSGQVTTAVTSAELQFVTIESSLAVIDDILGSVEVQDAILRDRPGADNEVRARKLSAIDAINAARRDVLKATEYDSALVALDTSRQAAVKASSAMDLLFSVIGSLQETSYFTNTDREGHKTTISTQRSKIQDAAGTIASARSTLQNASAGYDTKISSQESSIASLEGTRDRAKTDILTYEASIRTAEAQLALKRAGSRPSDLDAARARVRAAQANVARAAADYADTILTAPISGVISHVNIKAGESLPADAAVTMVGDSPFRIEMFVSEIDVPKLALTQSGSIELDAFRGVNMKLHLSEVDTTPTIKDGVSKYGVKLDFVYPHNEVKIGMTGDAVIVTGERANVVSVPRRAVLERDDGTYYVRTLLGKTVTEKDVQIGMEGEAGDVEITSGLEAGEIVIVLEKK